MVNKANLQDLFRGTEEAKASFGDANYMRAGHYLCRIEEVRAGERRVGGGYVVFGMQVVHVFDDVQGSGHRVGENVSHMLMRAGAQADMFLPSMKAAIGAICEGDPEAVTSGDLVAVVSDDQPLAGVVVEIVARNINTRRGTLFTRVTYKRPWTALELTNVLSEEAVKRFWPNGELQSQASLQQGQIG